ncbi:MAG: carboxypeptidase regulatory-like domain-containing protein [Elusimicrobia bacterium]|nr:carboxypeptidase regulatory-like domain-containing protein [Elusimicrobiota bacterium]
MTNVPCPRCGMPVGLDQEVCSHCRTPRDDMEMEEGRALVRKEELRRRRRPRLIAAGVAAAVLLTIAWLLRGLVLGPLLVAWSDLQIEIEKTRQPSHWVKPRTFPPAPVAAAPAHVAVSSFVYLGTNSPASVSFAQEPAQPPPARASAVVATTLPDLTPAPEPALSLGPGELHVRGTVYDLATGRPVPSVRVRFQQTRSDARWEATTNAAGRYQVGVYKNPSDAVVVMIEAPGYRKGLLEDRDPPYRERSASARADVMAETTDSDLEPVPIRYKESAQVVDLDLVLVPLAKK